ncbi:low temperature requirement protein LtrA [Microbacterium resistens]|uniref:Low temperature requirement protein LtrA n=1 Tax=Microbacterium resistens TaxID=156977 RepID=A0ABU1SGA8_9MICO|nr:low temperature requirement protein A [Microbacterium resistens]MDR6868579.1 low temperature requirement protein LtrA [Microbacterium resistens]
MSTSTPTGREHRLRRMVGRDPQEPHRAASPLELLYDLTLVVAFSQAGTQMAHLLEIGHYGAAISSFCFAMFAICWAWINFTWLASAFDNDDIFFRIATMVQMMGVLIMALGMPALFHSIDEGVHIDNVVLVAGYVVMRVSTLALWLRVAHDSPRYRKTALLYAKLIAVAQVYWIVLIFINPPLPVMVGLLLFAVVLEVLPPVIAERIDGGTPWHAHHVAERYSLLVIIALGEVILGTILAISAVVEEQGWTWEAGTVAFGGTALAFALWWLYFTMPSGEVLAHHRERGFGWGYGHIVLFGSVAAAGAGLHVASFVIQGEAKIDPTAAMLTLAIPVGIFIAALFILYAVLLRQLDGLHLWLFVGAILALVAAVVTVASGADLAVGIVVVVLSPVVVIVGYETIGHRHQDEAIARAIAS